MVREACCTWTMRVTKLTRLAVDAGYFDQSHFIREFRAFTGTAPRRFFQSVEHC
jgi:AraC-like DNA-binding protein